MNVKERLQKEHLARMRRIEIENLEKQYKEKEREAKYKRKLNLPSTTKMMAAYLFITLNAVLVFAMVAMWHFSDLSYLGVLITDIAGQVMTFCLYIVKSRSENLHGGLTYDMAMLEKQREYELEDREYGEDDNRAG